MDWIKTLRNEYFLSFYATWELGTNWPYQLTQYCLKSKNFRFYINKNNINYIYDLPRYPSFSCTLL